MIEELITTPKLSVGRNEDFMPLLLAKDINGLMTKMETRSVYAEDALRDYDPRKHKINSREDKIIKDKKGNYKRTIKRWKLPINYPQYINEIALVFLYGRPVIWGQKSENTDKAYEAFTKLLKRTHFNSKIRQCKRYAGAETQSAMLFRVYLNSDGKPDCQIRVLAKSKGDTIHTRWDEYENLTAAGWEYYLVEGNDSVRHFDLFLPDMIYRCTEGKNGWEIVPEKNLVGKIPLIVFQQEKEWAGVEKQIEREEYIASRTADTNDYFADPQQILNADIIKNMPEKDDENKTLVINSESNAKDAAAYLTWDSAPESKKAEIQWLQNHILSKTFTPNIDFDNMKSLSNVSGKALKQMMILANIKAQKHQEVHDEMLERTANVMKAIIGNVLDVSLAEECRNLEITHEFQEPFGEDVAELVTTLAKAVDSSFLSRKSAVEQSPLTKDSSVEQKRLEAEEEKASEAQRDLFTQTAFQARGIDEGGFESAE